MTHSVTEGGKMATVQVKCKQCKAMFTARVADRKRGWGMFCSKSCKAKKQEKRTGQHAAYQRRQKASEYCDPSAAFYDRTGEYVGFSAHNFSNEDHGFHNKD